ncbi:MAG: hypothetical protein K6G83_08350 [Lachnospiraceae bacterium]|nr:hypothetical protein [Lachnospiraceae bacterium]
MSLIVLFDEKEIYDHLPKEEWLNFRKYVMKDGPVDDHIQSDFCDLITFELQEFLETKVIRDYFTEFGLEYVPDYKMKAEEWGPLSYQGDDPQFIMFLHPRLQFALTALYREHFHYLIHPYLLDATYTMPLLRERNLYVLEDPDHITLDGQLFKLLENGVDIVVGDLHSRDFSESYPDDFLRALWKLESKYSYISKEMDIQYFGEEKATDIQTDLYTLLSGSDTGVQYTDNEDMYRSVRVSVSTPISFKEDDLRRLPLYYLDQVGDTWFFRLGMSVKYPSFEDLIGELLLGGNAPAKRIMLVLNCNERCDVRKYPEYIKYIMVYDSAKHELEVLGKNGLHIFREALHQSVEADETE